MDVTLQERIAESNLKILKLDVNVFGTLRRIHPVLLWDSESATLVDAGYPGETEMLRQAVEAAGVSFGQIRRILVTHQDWDHIGTLPELLNTYGDMEIFAHLVEKPYIEGRLPNPKWTPQKISERIASLPLEFRAKGAATFAHLPTAAVHRTFNDADVLPFYGGIRVIHAPGHTPGHVCFFLPRFHLLIAGDELRVEDNELVGPNPEFTPDLPTALASLKKLTSGDVDWVLCYHGGLYGPGAARRIAELANKAG